MDATKVMLYLLRRGFVIKPNPSSSDRDLWRTGLRYQNIVLIAIVGAMILPNFVFLARHSEDVLEASHAITTGVSSSMCLLIYALTSRRRSDVERLLTDLEIFAMHREFVRIVRFVSISEKI